MMSNTKTAMSGYFLEMQWQIQKKQLSWKGFPRKGGARLQSRKESESVRVCYEPFQMIHYLTYVRMVPWLNVFLKGIQIFRPHSRPLGLGIWNFKSSLGDCDAHQQLITGEMPVCSCGDKSWHSSGGTWKKNQGLRVTCLWVWWPYFPNKNARLSCRPSRMQGHVPAVCVHEDRE